MNVKSQWSVSLDACRWFWVGGMKLARVWTKSPRGKFLRYLPKVKTSLHANHLLRCSACFREVFSMPQINNMEFPLCMFHKFFGFFFCCYCCLVTFLSKSTAICVLFSSPSFPFRKKKKKSSRGLVYIQSFLHPAWRPETKRRLADSESRLKFGMICLSSLGSL